TSRYVAEATQQKWPLPADVFVEPVAVEGVCAEWQSFADTSQSGVLLYFHGGGWILDSPGTHRPLTTAMARSAKMRVFSVDYRLAPEHRHPAHLEDCVACYKWLLSNKVAPGNIVVAGDSAGGNLTLATLLYLRDNRIPLPAGAVLISPSTDLTHSDETYFANGATDPILADSGVFWWKTAYAGGMDLTNPLISPLHGDMAGLPPLLFQVSTSEMLYGETRQCAEKAGNTGVDVTLETWDDMPHVFQQFGLHRLKEADKALAGIGAFIQRVAQIR
ncbi:MAG: alpha/beta hydrolase, partial [Deltaproteobacteria bacterium]|nr:alpha/beta hydrolase [Deltaproteobacteria bacterium]